MEFLNPIYRYRTGSGWLPTPLLLGSAAQDTGRHGYDNQLLHWCVVTGKGKSQVYAG